MQMLSVKRHGSDGILVVMLHWLGGSARTFDEVCEQLSLSGFFCLAVDLPGFGGSQENRDFSIPAMTLEVIDTIRLHRRDQPDAPWLLVGHSMGGKLASLISRAAEQGDEGLAHLRGVVLLSPSPPGPEPMKESKRATTLRSLGPATRAPVERCKYAETFVDDNTGKLPLLDAIRMRTADDVLRMNPDALVAWMTTGSKTDCSESVGVLQVPALILAGTEDQALGPDAQTSQTLPHWAHATLVALEGGGHLAPIERPHEVSDRMLEFFHGLDLKPETTGTNLGKGFSSLIHSNRTSPQTRKALLGRMEHDPSVAGVMDAEERRTLRALVARVIPGVSFDLASRIDQWLARGKGDGWRFGALPEDAQAWKLGLASLDAAARERFGVPFVAVDSGRQDDLLKRAQDGLLEKGRFTSLNIFDHSRRFNAGQMRAWFEDVRGELVKLYVADPRTMERIGFAGFADEAGFVKIKLEEQDEVEP